jgi:predicted glycosyltransferase involved in capsule biosynthesis
MNNYKFTFVIGFRYQSDRFFNLKRTLDWINSFSNVEVLLVEQDKHSKIKHLNLNCKHIFIKSDKPYNRSWAFNVALKRANSNIIVFGDSDLIIEQNQFIEGVKALSKFDMVSPYSKVIDLSPQETSQPLPNMLKIDRVGRGETDNQKINISGGIAMFRKDALLKIGGWNEDFIGWGAEDDEMTIRVHKHLKWTELKGTCYHLYHARSAPQMDNYQHNLKLLQKISQLSDQQIVSMINRMGKKSGLKNKFDN